MEVILDSDYFQDQQFNNIHKEYYMNLVRDFNKPIQAVHKAWHKFNCSSTVWDSVTNWVWLATCILRKAAVCSETLEQFETGSTGLPTTLHSEATDLDSSFHKERSIKCSGDHNRLPTLETVSQGYGSQRGTSPANSSQHANKSS